MKFVQWNCRSLRSKLPEFQQRSQTIDVIILSENWLHEASLVGKPEGKIPLGRRRCRWVDNIKMNLRKIGWDDMDLIDLAQDRDQWMALVNTVMNLRVP
jgi:hypothetical protein